MQTEEGKEEKWNKGQEGGEGSGGERDRKGRGGGGEFVLILSSHLILPSPGPLSSFHSSMSSMFYVSSVRRISMLTW